MSDPRITVELYGLPRQRAGVEVCHVAPGRLGAVVAALATALPGLVPDIIRDGRITEHALLAIDGQVSVTDPATDVPAGTVLVLISAQAGG